MSFLNAPFPDECFAFGTQGDLIWMTHIATSSGGGEFAQEVWQDNLRSYDVSLAVKTMTDYVLVRDHFNEVRGRAYRFPLKDHLDYECTQANGALRDTTGATAPAGNGTFYLHKRYGTVNPYYRKITRPDNPVVIYRTRSAVTSVITPTVTYTTGAVALTGHVAGDTYSWTGTFKVPCRYEQDRLPAVVIDREGAEGELLVRCSSIPIRERRE
jgi:uncharacterized protein (TIGR02217 family)